MKWFRRALFAAPAALVMLVLPTAPSQAAVKLTQGLGPLSYHGWEWADDSYENYWLDASLTSSMKTGMSNALISSLDPKTDIRVANEGRYNTSVDLWAVGTTSPPLNLSTSWAWTNCIKWVSTYVCDQKKVTYNKNMTHPDYWAVGCHELGHAIGFAHAEPNDDNITYPTAERTCLRGNPDVRNYSIDNISKINAYY